MNKSLNELYKKQITELTQTIYRLRTKSRVFVITEILSFAVSIAFVVMFTVLNNASWTLGVALCVLFLYFLYSKL